MLHIITKTQRDNKNSRRYIRERIRSYMNFYFCLLWDWISRLKLKIQNSNNKGTKKPLYLTYQKTLQKSTNFALKEDHKDIAIKNEMEYTPSVYHASNQLVFFSTLPTTKSNANFAFRGTYNDNNNKANVSSSFKTFKLGIITDNPPVVWAKITLPTRGLKSVT